MSTKLSSVGQGGMKSEDPIDAPTEPSTTTTLPSGATSIFPPEPWPDKEAQLRLARYRLEESERLKKNQERMQTMILLMFFLTFVTLAFYFASRENPEIYNVDEETQRYVNRAFNAVILLLIPFLLGAVGAFTRLLISGLKVASHIGLVVASGLISAFSWVGIKSGVLMKMVAPHLAAQGIEPVPSASFETGFYTMVLVALLVGMFSSNVYIFVNEKVESILSKKKAAEHPES